MTTIETTSVRKRQSMGPSSIVIQHTPAGTTPRTAFGPSGASSVIMRSNVTSSYSAPIIRPLGETAKVSKESVQNVMSTRGIEKRELGDLNSKLADYIDKVKYMEACNKAMTEEIEKLRKMKGYTQDRVREEYEDELKEARETIAQLSKELAPLQAKTLELEDKLDTKDQEINALRKQREELSNQINKMTQMCGDLEGECATLRMRLESLGKENEMLKCDIQRVRDDNDRIRHDFEVAIAKQIDCQNQVEALTEELQFTNDAYRAEIEELTNLLANYKSIQPNMEKLWKSEFKECIQAIQAEYNDQLARMTAEQQRRCDEQIMSMQMGLRRDNTDAEIIKTESKTLKSAMGETKNRLANLERENAGLRAELAALKDKFEEEYEECEREKAELRQRIMNLETEIAETIVNLNELQNTNLDLRLEIECYRKLLEGEENSMKRLIEDKGRVQSAGGAMLAGLISGGVQSSQTSTMSESSGLVRVSRSSKCAISIAEIAQDGSMVRLENGSDKKDFDLSKWTLERKHPKGTSSYSFPAGFKLGAKKSIKIFSSGSADDAGSDDTVASKEKCKTWGNGDGSFKLMDESGTEKANATIEFTRR